MSDTKPLIYCVEDEESIRGLVAYVLAGQGFEVGTFESAPQFWEAIERSRPQLILLDIMLEGESGLAILRRLRCDERFKRIPVIMLTAKTSEIDVVSGLDSGADDYIPKPFSVVELVARIKAVLRRAGQKTTEDTSVLTAGAIVLDEDRHTVTCHGEPVKLTLKEYELLQYFMTNTGLALSRERIMGAVWGFSFEGESRTVDMHVMTLRQRLGEEGKRLQTVRGIGYRWEGDA